MYKELLSFSSWNLYATLSWMIKGQGINMLLNIFFGPTINAARGIAFQVNSAVKSFTTNFSTAFNPQITKLYATEQYSELHQFIIQCSKISFLLMFFLSLPLMTETHYVLGLWLGLVPEHWICWIMWIIWPNWNFIMFQLNSEFLINRSIIIIFLLICCRFGETIFH